MYKISINAVFFSYYFLSIKTVTRSLRKRLTSTDSTGSPQVVLATPKKNAASLSAASLKKSAALNAIEEKGI